MLKRGNRPFLPIETSARLLSGEPVFCYPEITDFVFAQNSFCQHVQNPYFHQSLFGGHFFFRSMSIRSLRRLLICLIVVTSLHLIPIGIGATLIALVQKLHALARKRMRGRPPPAKITNKPPFDFHGKLTEYESWKWFRFSKGIVYLNHMMPELLVCDLQVILIRRFSSSIL